MTRQADDGLIFAGDVYIRNRRTEGGGFYDIGNTTALSLKTDSEKKQRISRRKASWGQPLDSISLKKPTELKLKLDTFDKTNLAMALHGKESVIEAQIRTVTDEEITVGVKGKVSMEELRGQLGERLTPAMAIAAKSMGVTTAELEKMVESGISAEAFLPKFGAAMEEAFAGAESAQASVNRLKNQFDELLLKFGEEGGINAAYQKLLDDVGAGLSWIEEKIGSLDGALTGGLSDGLTSAYELIKEVGAEAYEAFGSLMDTINECGNRAPQP